MKGKYSSILGITVALSLVLSLLAPMLAVSPVQAGDNKWSEWTVPEEGEDGDWVLYSGSDAGPFGIAENGRTLFAAVCDDDWGDGAATYAVMKSTDRGYTWDKTDLAGLDEPIVAIAISPDYDDDEILYVATTTDVYESDDAGDEFNMEWSVPAGETITCMDVSLVKGDLPVVVGTTEDVYFCEDGADVEAQGFNEEVLAVKFSPKFKSKSDHSVAIVTVADGSTWLRFGQWDEDTDDLDVDAPCTEATEIIDEEADSASIAIPDDFDASEVEDGILFVGLNAPDGQGDVYLIDDLDETAAGDVEDLDANENIGSLAVSGSVDDSDEVFIVAGNADKAEVLISEDGGDRWPSKLVRKQPIGDASTVVAMSPDFDDNGLLYCTTQGDESGLYASGKAGSSVANGNKGYAWNGLGLIDTEITAIGAVGASLGYHLAGDNTVIILTAAVTGPGLAVLSATTWDDGSLWKTVDAGKTWERIYYVEEGLTGLKNLTTPAGETGTVFVAQVSNDGEELYRSDDGGDTFRKTITMEEGIITSSQLLCASEDIILTGDADGNVYATVDAGDEWEKGDTESGDQIRQIVLKGRTVIVSTDAGEAYICVDAGENFEDIDSFERIGRRGDPDVLGDCRVYIATDLGWDTNHILYLTDFGHPWFTPEDDELGNGVFRTVVDMDDPEASDWDNIDSQEAIYYGTAVLPGNILYTADVSGQEDESDNPSGIRRISWPAAENEDDAEDSAQWINDGLPDDSRMALFGGTIMPSLLFALRIEFWDDGGPYGASTANELYLYKDTLASPVELGSPAADATNTGTIYEGQTDVEVTLIWQELKDADAYHFQVARDEDFTILEGIEVAAEVATFSKWIEAMFDVEAPEVGWVVDGTLAKVELTPNIKYYWRVRAIDPAFSPWSETRMFGTVLGPGVSRPELVSPYDGILHGGVDTQTKPTFQWTSVEGATGYSLQVSKAASFATVDIEVTTGVGETAWMADKDLGTTTTMFWRVKGLGPSESPWSDVGSFTTMAEPPPPPEPAQITVEPAPQAPPAAPVTPGWVWVVIAIGAVLVIAVIVLIARTRRV